MAVPIGYINNISFINITARAENGALIRQLRKLAHRAALRGAHVACNTQHDALHVASTRRAACNMHRCVQHAPVRATCTRAL